MNCGIAFTTKDKQKWIVFGSKTIHLTEGKHYLFAKNISKAEDISCDVLKEELKSQPQCIEYLKDKNIVVCGEKNGELELFLIEKDKIKLIYSAYTKNYPIQQIAQL